MAKANTFSQNLLKLLFQNITFPNIGDATGIVKSTTDGVVYISLYTVMPTATTNGTEAAYGGYLRVSIPRNSTNIQVGTTDPITVKNINDITFPVSTNTSSNIVGAGLSFTSTGRADIFGIFVTPIVVINGTTPKIPALQFKMIEY